MTSYFVVVICCILAANYSSYNKEFHIFAGSEQDVEYELEEVWDGAKWHVIHKMVPKKTDIGNFVC